MSPILVPARRRGSEILDDPSVEPDVMRRAMKDVEVANAILGGRRAALAELDLVLQGARGETSLLDVGTGSGDIPASAVARAAKRGIRLRTIGLDLSPALVGVRGGSRQTVRASALALPFRDRSVDVVLASQLLHHFPADEAETVVREMTRVARRAVVISDLRRSLLAAAGIWLGSFPLRFHPVSRHDGVVSVMRGFLPRELADIVERATGRRPKVRRRLGFRLTTHLMNNADA